MRLCAYIGSHFLSRRIGSSARGMGSHAPGPKIGTRDPIPMGPATLAAMTYSRVASKLVTRREGKCCMLVLHRRSAISLALATLLAVVGVFVPDAGTQAAGVSMSGLHVVGNQIENGSGQAVRLLGVDRSGTEYACIQGWGIFDGPSDAASVQAMAAWHVNAVRVPLNEDCWLGINGVPAADSGTNYQQAITTYVNLLNANGMAAILDLHWNAPGSSQATSQQPMPDQDHAPAFWQSVATAFKGNSSVLFDLYNEPYPDNNSDTSAAWSCLKNGGTCSGVSYQAAGMQELVTTIRNTGATNIILVGGVQYANGLSQWLAYEPSDPTGNLGASWHSYAGEVCNSQSCWDSTVKPVAAKVPVVAGEIGENDCAHGYIDALMPYLDGLGQSYVAWAWNTADCASFPALITNYNGTPTTFGQGYQAHLAAIAGTQGGSSTSTIGVEGYDSELFANHGTGFVPLGGGILAAPALVTLPSGTHLYVATGFDHRLWDRT